MTGAAVTTVKALVGLGAAADDEVAKMTAEFYEGDPEFTSVQTVPGAVVFHEGRVHTVPARVVSIGKRNNNNDFLQYYPNLTKAKKVRIESGSFDSIRLMGGSRISVKGGGSCMFTVI